VLSHLNTLSQPGFPKFFQTKSPLDAHGLQRIFSQTKQVFGLRTIWSPFTSMPHRVYLQSQLMMLLPASISLTSVLLWGIFILEKRIPIEVENGCALLRQFYLSNASTFGTISGSSINPLRTQRYSVLHQQYRLCHQVTNCHMAAVMWFLSRKSQT
jgi:hypothetical protein